MFINHESRMITDTSRNRHESAKRVPNSQSEMPLTPNVSDRQAEDPIRTSRIKQRATANGERGTTKLNERATASSSQQRRDVTLTNRECESPS